MHTHKYTNVSVCISKTKAIINGCPFIRNQIFYFGTSERSEQGKILARYLRPKGGTQFFSWYADLYAASTVSTHHLWFFWKPPKYWSSFSFIFCDYHTIYSHFHHNTENNHFSEKIQNIEIQNFEPKNGPRLRIYETIRVPATWILEKKS